MAKLWSESDGAVWMVNPRRLRGRTRRRKKRRVSHAKEATMARRRKRVRRRARRRSYRRRARRNPAPVMALNPRRRRRGRRRRSYRRRSYRRNPPPLTARGVQAMGTDVLWAGAGLIGTKFIGNAFSGVLAPMTGPTALPLVRIAGKAAIAYMTAWGFEMMLGKRTAPFTPIFLGGMAEVIQDTVRTYISPQFPMLAAAEEPMMAYEEVSDYEQALLGQGWDTPEDLPERSGAAALSAYETVL